MHRTTHLERMLRLGIGLFWIALPLVADFGPRSYMMVSGSLALGAVVLISTLRRAAPVARADAHARATVTGPGRARDANETTGATTK